MLSTTTRARCAHCGQELFFGVGHDCPERPDGDKQEATKHQIEGGSTRSERAPAYHLVPPYGGRRVAARFALGAEKHGEGNWMKSVKAGPRECGKFCQEAYNHMMEHAAKMMTREDPEDDHLAAIGWAVEALCYAEHYWGTKWTDLTAESRPYASGETIRQTHMG